MPDTRPAAIAPGVGLDLSGCVGIGRGGLGDAGGHAVRNAADLRRYLGER